MARAGDTIENPLSGERIHFRVTGAETGGAYFSGRIVLAPLGAGPPEHVHPVIEERFRILSGVISARVGGSERTYGPGEEIVVPPGTAHRWWNATDEPVELEFHVSPALPLDRFLSARRVAAPPRRRVVRRTHGAMRSMLSAASVGATKNGGWSIDRPPSPA